MHMIAPKKLKQEFYLTETDNQFIENARQQARSIIEGEDLRLAIVMGPCSIHDIEGALEYAKRFKQLAKAVEETCFLVMRVYIEKPRSILGWKGLLNDPYLDGSCDIATGIRLTRSLLLELVKMEVPAAVEFVDPLAAVYFEDLVTWGFIGARTSESQPHRMLASSFPFPMGFKNATDGDIRGAVNGVLAAGGSHTFLSIDDDGKVIMRKTEGNPDAHIVLRGAEDMPNYDEVTVQNASQILDQKQLKPRLMIDCAHGNSGKDYLKQREVFAHLIERISEGNEQIFGIMLESNLEAGNQSASPDSCSTVSVTDPCLDWSMTEELVLSASLSLC